MSAKDGTMNNTRLPLPAMASAIFKDVNVLPVPQAMTSFPRSCSANLSRTASIAASWWGRSRLAALTTTRSGLLQEYWDQSIRASSR